MVVRGEVTHCVCVTYMQQMAAGGPSLIVCVCVPIAGVWDKFDHCFMLCSEKG